MSGRVQTYSRAVALALRDSRYILIKFWGDDLLSDDYLGNAIALMLDARSDGLYFEYKNRYAFGSSGHTMFDEDRARADKHDEVYAGVHLTTSFTDWQSVRSVQTNTVGGYF